jgi:hypothetical protein
MVNQNKENKTDGLNNVLEGVENSSEILVEKFQGWTALGKPNHKWESNIKMDLTEIGADESQRVV